jgi:hypothetical protein
MPLNRRPLLLALLLLPGPLHALKAQTAELAATRLADLQFGNLAPGEARGECTLAPGGGRTVSGGVSLCGGAAQSAQFEVQGPAGAPFSIQVSPDPAVFHHGRDAYQVTFEAAVAGREWLFDAGGRALVQVGGTLQVPGDAGPCTLPPVALRFTVCCGHHAPASASFSLRGRIMAALRVRESAAMNFGRLVSPHEDSLIRLEPAGGLTPVSGGALVILGNQARPGGFELTGEPGAGFSVTLPTGATLHGPAGTMELEDFRSDLPSGRGTLAGGTATVQVGATLRVKANQPPGLYRGTYLLAFSYD